MCIFLVSAAGSISVVPNAISTSFGSSGSLDCSARGGPNNTFQWTLQGRVISNISQIQFPFITGSDGGLYTCRVTNAAGFFTNSALITGNIL